MCLLRQFAALLHGTTCQKRATLSMYGSYTIYPRFKPTPILYGVSGPVGAKAREACLPAVRGKRIMGHLTTCNLLQMSTIVAVEFEDKKPSPRAPK
jgi:hypothetical protein